MNCSKDINVIISLFGSDKKIRNSITNKINVLRIYGKVMKKYKHKGFKFQTKTVVAIIIIAIIGGIGEIYKRHNV